MWAQGLTIALLIAAGALTQTRRAAMAAEVCLIYQISQLSLDLLSTGPGRPFLAGCCVFTFCFPPDYAHADNDLYTISSPTMSANARKKLPWRPLLLPELHNPL